MKRKIVLVVIRALLVAGLLSIWSPWSYGIPCLRSFPLPGSHQFWETVFGEDILPWPDQGFLFFAWVQGPFFLAINSLTWLPFTFVILYPLHKSGIRVRALGVALLLAGSLNCIWACLSSVPLRRYSYSARIPIGENYHLFFDFFPMLVLGAIAVFEAFRILKAPLPQPPPQAARL